MISETNYCSLRGLRCFWANN